MGRVCPIAKALGALARVIISRVARSVGRGGAAIGEAAPEKGVTSYSGLSTQKEERHRP